MKRKIAFMLVFLALGGGAAYSETKPTSKYELAAFVERAVNYARVNGKATALREFMNPNGQFVKGELYIFAYDFQGTVLANGGQPELVGKNLIDMKDGNGVEVIKQLIKLAQQGGGWLRYLWPNPAHNNKIESKLSNVMKVDDSWFLGSGIYDSSKTSEK
jgi:polar amino acid transport system substrate-binding protein